ncbi:zinc finger protein 624-like [Culex quinquefasciatus]|uniref:zinc finger protein 624-like n=1 Tax=Culex quinquefasciatus TaxID=7176 RepID=UPI00016DA5EB|nr:zinc finger protein 624-like [Culex quinquefasciatus]
MAELKTDDSEVKEGNIGPEESTVIYKTIFIQEESELINGDLLADEDIKQEIIELEEYELNVPAVEPAQEATVSNESSVSKEPVIMLEKRLRHPRNMPYPRKECEHCGKTFAFQYNLAVHRVKEHGSTETPTKICLPPKTSLPPNLRCDQCGKLYHHKANLAKHKAKVHGIGEAPPKSFVHTCKHCKKQLTSWKSLVEHLKFIHGEIIDPTQIALCPLCLKRFTTAEELSGHSCSRRNQGEMDLPFKCDLCDKAYSGQTSLYAHYSVHPEYHNFKCDQCPSGFFNKTRLNIHKKALHVSKDDYLECNICNMRYKNQQVLRYHQKLHAIRAYCCEFCGKSFETRERLRAHQYNKHAIQDALPYKCSFPKCDKSFLYNCQLKSHEQCHKNKKSPLYVQRDPE